MSRNTRNKPYVRIHNEFGVLTNPITKDNPYISGSSQKVKSSPRKSNNRRGVGLVVAQIGKLSFAKYRIVKQQIENRLIVHSVLVQ